MAFYGRWTLSLAFVFVPPGRPRQTRDFEGWGAVTPCRFVYGKMSDSRHVWVPKEEKLKAKALAAVAQARPQKWILRSAQCDALNNYSKWTWNVKKNSKKQRNLFFFFFLFVDQGKCEALDEVLKLVRRSVWSRLMFWEVVAWFDRIHMTSPWSCKVAKQGRQRPAHIVRGLQKKPIEMEPMRSFFLYILNPVERNAATRMSTQCLQRPKVLTEKAGGIEEERLKCWDSE